MKLAEIITSLLECGRKRKPKVWRTKKWLAVTSPLYSEKNFLRIVCRFWKFHFLYVAVRIIPARNGLVIGVLVVVSVSICQGRVRLLRFPAWLASVGKSFTRPKKKTFTPANGPCFVYRHGRGRNDNVHKKHSPHTMGAVWTGKGRGNRHSRAVRSVVCDRPLAVINYAFAYYTNVYTGTIICIYIYTCRHMHLRVCVCVCVWHENLHTGTCLEILFW